MTAASFKAWRKSARLSQSAAARAIGIGARNVFAYEHGEKPVPLTVRLACAAYALGLRDYDGPVCNAPAPEYATPLQHLDGQEP